MNILLKAIPFAMLAMALAFYLNPFKVTLTSLPTDSDTCAAPVYINKTYNINLDLPPKQRWEELITDYKTELTSYANDLVYKVPLLGTFLSNVAEHFLKDSEISEEVNAISELSGIRPGAIYLINYIYEFSAFCTSVVARNASGTILHAKNLDYGLANHFARLSARVNFYRGGELLVLASTHAGYVGIHSGMRNGGFAISVNQRSNGSFIGNMYRVFWKRLPPATYNIRQALENSTNYSNALNYLSNVEVPASCYFIISGVGPNDGGVIEREYTKTYNFYSLSEASWFLVQTNYDRDLPDPTKDERRTPAETRMNGIGFSGLNSSSLFEGVMKLWPNCNPATISTQIYVVQSNEVVLNTWK